MSISEALALSGQTALLGISVVFIALIFLSVVITVLNRAFSTEKHKKAEAANAAAPLKAADLPQNAAAGQGIDPKVVAAIIAAVEAASGKSSKNLRFTAIRRQGEVHNAWIHASRENIINSRKF